jgi:glycosyltransferase involved in cell wall biosynthesis
MHVLVTADTVGGVWTYTRELVSGLAERDIRVTLVSFGEIPSAEQTEWLDKLRGVDYRATAFRLEWMQDAEEDLRQSSEFLRDVIAEVRPNVLHLSQYHYGSLMVDVPKVVIAHSDVLSWWEAVHGWIPHDDKWLSNYRMLVTAGLRDADYVIAPSRWMLGEIQRFYGKMRRAGVIHNGRNPGRFNPHTTKEDLVLAVGRVWDKGKNVALLMEHPHSLPVWIAGTEEHPDPSWQNGKTEVDRARGVRFLGKQSETQLRQLFSRASMYAATSQYEPFGLAPVEAAFSRCALIANDTPAFRELWGESACYFRHNDAEDLARCMESLQHNRELRMTYANLAYRRAKQRFTAERMVNDYVNVYRSLTSVGAAVA